MTTPEGVPPEPPPEAPSGVPTGPDYDRAAARIGNIMLGIGLLGTAVLFVVRGWQWGTGFFVGSLLSVLNYRSLRALVDSLGGDRPRRRGSTFLAFRYLLLGGLAYVIVRFTSVSLPAVFAGLLILTAAIMIEAAIEVLYVPK
jgi:hypothetical protein